MQALLKTQNNYYSQRISDGVTKRLGLNNVTMDQIYDISIINTNPTNGHKVFDNYVLRRFFKYLVSILEQRNSNIKLNHCQTIVENEQQILP